MVCIVSQVAGSIIGKGGGNIARLRADVSIVILTSFKVNLHLFPIFFKNIIFHFFQLLSYLVLITFFNRIKFSSYSFRTASSS